MNTATGTPARNTKVMNRLDLTSKLLAKLKNEEAVIGGIGNTNFDLWAAGHRPQNFYMLGSMGLHRTARRHRVAAAPGVGEPLPTPMNVALPLVALPAPEPLLAPGVTGTDDPLPAPGAPGAGHALPLPAPAAARRVRIDSIRRCPRTPR